MLLSQDIPEDPTGTYDAERKFVLENLDLCRLAGVSLLVVEVGEPFLTT